MENKVYTRKHYMTLCMMNNTEVTCIYRGNYTEVTFEEAIDKGFKNVSFVLENLSIIQNNGYSQKEIDWFKEFIKNNAVNIRKEALGVL